jgi:hypothetical protein
MERRARAGHGAWQRAGALQRCVVMAVAVAVRTWPALSAAESISVRSAAAWKSRRCLSYRPTCGASTDVTSGRDVVTASCHDGRRPPLRFRHAPLASPPTPSAHVLGVHRVSMHASDDPLQLASAEHSPHLEPLVVEERDGLHIEQRVHGLGASLVVQRVHLLQVIRNSTTRWRQRVRVERLSRVVR